MKITLGSVIVFALIMLTACSSVETYETVEVYVIPNMEESAEDGQAFVDEGYKKVNSISVIEEGKHHIKSSIKSIEDYYDNNGTYLKTMIIQIDFNKSTVTDVQNGDKKTAELTIPPTILLPEEDIEEFFLDNLTDSQKEQVKKHILSYTDKLEENKE